MQLQPAPPGHCLNYPEFILLRHLLQFLRPACSSIEMNHHYSLRARVICCSTSERSRLYVVMSGFHQHRLEPVIRYCKDRCYIGVSRHNYLITLTHHSHLYPTPENKPESIKAVGNTYTMPYPNVCSILLSKAVTSSPRYQPLLTTRPIVSDNCGSKLPLSSEYQEI